MKKLVLAASVLALTLSGCSTQVSYGDPQEVETVDVAFGSTDLQKIAGEMTDSMISSPLLTDITNNNRPIVFVERIKNKTTEHIDTESVTDSISTKLLQSGKFRFVDMTRVTAVREQLDFQNDGGLVDPSKAIAFGQQVGAEYMLYGNLSSIVKTNKKTKDVYYKMTMRLMDLKTGLVEWADETEIRKGETKSTFGW
ncbi:MULTISPECIES: penicillin-binding protein activator LpoB [unclassified Agarivorans]|uniref:penicillin-binding protein activator LpoB n=1 Tax=unclassified Agarivorans TaxID=2636026 RepID=UPI0010D581B0|nr:MULTISPECIES: penicillin-binding protein activator LpoB [unclassified Agarivorans]MDO6686379.1 penicillin-binding protein activator LpoB [Agarivorans sp. 3_MG-2023]MDO6713681.1 penicillin-binding protein activator LpoB [Agarivorans sp. 2_MG-2023]MDO6762002.1 penicillin-binding protein activator LpoB [Agarivorans sp. 1_MG-2023]GDY25867.1 penicillin-binding protein activator LpoB [Agarivorans sp. Toyoura001]